MAGPPHPALPRPYLIAPRPLSRLTYKIMSMNLTAILILVIGIAYLDQYRQGLTRAETENLSTETQLYAAILGESSLTPENFNLASATKILGTLVGQKKQQIAIFSADGKLLLDTKTLGLKTTALEKPSPDDELPGAVGRWLENGFASLVDIFSIRFNLPPYPLVDTARSASYPNVDDALEGVVSLSAWQGPSGGLILSAAAPIGINQNLVGAVLVTRPDTSIEATFANTRLDILKLFLIALTITMSLSLYLSGVIGHPLRQLAAAAEAVREGNGRGVEIPDMSERQDEIGELSIALRQMTTDLNDRLDSIEKFAADVAHELKNPLTSMRSAIETLQKVKSENDRQRLSDIIMHDLQRMDRLITDISQASRLDAELSRDVLSVLDLRDVLLPLIDIYRKPIEREGSAQESTAAIQFSGLGAPVMVVGQAHRLSQVFQNLIGNALSFSPPGHAVQLRVEPTGDLVKVIVEDNGPGIPETKLEKIFERFYSERPSGEAFGRHSGLGLSIARQIIEVHGGTIHAENRTDGAGTKLGARFIVYLKAPRL